MRFNVKTSRPTRHLNALTLSRGSVRRSELVEMVNKPNKIVAMDSDISIILPPQSSPRAHVLFYTTFDNGDLIADSIQLDVLPDKSNEVVVSVAPSTQEPGNNVSISVKGLCPTIFVIFHERGAQKSNSTTLLAIIMNVIM